MLFKVMKLVDEWHCKQLQPYDMNAIKNQVSCEWFTKEKDRIYTVYVDDAGYGTALEKGRELILAYIEERKDPMVLVNKVIAGKAEFTKYDEIIYELARAVRELKDGISCCNHAGRETS